MADNDYLAPLPDPDDVVPLSREKKIASIKEAIQILQTQQQELEDSIRKSKDGVENVKQKK